MQLLCYLNFALRNAIHLDVDVVVVVVVVVVIVVVAAILDCNHRAVSYLVDDD